MPGLIPRPAQLECFAHVKQENTIVNMPTGCGKTLVAVLALDHFLAHGKAIFVVPTAALVPQQAEYIRTHCSHRPLEVVEAQAGKMDGEEMLMALKRYNVLVGTPVIVFQAFQEKRIDLTDVSLLIFDECHNATGASPMANIMRDVVHRHEGKTPRILGLTASFVNGSLQDIGQKRQILEGTLSSKLFCPDISDQRDVKYHRVVFRQEDDLLSPVVDDLLAGLLSRLLHPVIAFGVPVDNMKELQRQSRHVLEEAGLHCFGHHIKGLVPQALDLLEEAAKSHLLSREMVSQARNQICQAPELLLSELRSTAESAGLSLPEVTSKAKQLLELLRKYDHDHESRILIFCEQIVLATPLVELVRHFMGRGAAAVAGGSTMSPSQQSEVLQAFRSGTCPILVCTAAVEEGIDVAECKVVVRYSKVATTKAHIQGAGRARKMQAEVYYFENDPHLEEQKAKHMQSIARRSELSLTPEEMEERRGHKDVEGVHPYRTEDGSEISIFNCMRIVNEYVAKTMKQTFDLEENMMVFEEEVIQDFPPVVRKKLIQVNFPSPDGFQSVTLADVESWWKQVRLEDVADKERLKRLKEKDKEKRRFFFCLAVFLAQHGYIDKLQLKASPEALALTSLKCQVWGQQSGISLSSQFDKLRPSAGVSEQQLPQSQPQPPYTGFPASSADSYGATVETQPIESRLWCLDAASRQAAAAAPAVAIAPAAAVVPPRSTGVPSINQDAKSVLNSTLNIPLNYRSEPSPSGGFICSVEIPQRGSFQGEAKRTKKEAEQSAAAAALAAVLGSGGVLPTPAAPRVEHPPVQAVNYKGRLNDKFTGKINYTTIGDATGGFISTAQTPFGSFQGMSCRNKKDAEQSAAERAWLHSDIE